MGPGTEQGTGLKGLIFDIQRFSVHDGPGIRTTVFLKGCPLHCAWCQNPEGGTLAIGLWHFDNRCLGCGACIAVCPEHALTLDRCGEHPHVAIDRQRCALCGQCVADCPAGALTFDGRELTVAAVLDEVRRDRMFYDASGGGVTLSGGDPLLQADFALAVLAACRAEGIHTAIETCLAAPWATVARFVGVVDLFIADLKLADPVLHVEQTGQGNELIRRNVEQLARAGVNLRLRIPLVPDVTATAANLRALAEYIGEHLPAVPVELINFNPLARAKYRRLARSYPFAQYTAPFADEQVRAWEELLRGAGARVWSPNNLISNPAYQKFP